MRERRRYRANMPESAWPGGREPRARSARWKAVRDLAIGLHRYLGDGPDAGDWAAFACQLGASRSRGEAPDGSRWGITTVVDYP